MRKPTLLVLAAGMGSRYGGLKQMAEVGPGGETLLDYAVHDALAAGFRKIVFVIRPDFEQAFRENVLSRFPRDVAVDLAFQEVSAVPSGSLTPRDREKPWGTGHAVLAARAQVREPFAVINADDYYGPEAYRQAAAFVRGAHKNQWPLPFCLVAFELGRTLSAHGTVSRGVCAVSEKGFLAGITETTGLAATAAGAVLADDGAEGLSLSTPVSMNFFVFMPQVFAFLEDQFRQFLAAHGSELKSEFYLPAAVATMIARNQARVTVLPSKDQWMGVTYAEDRSGVEARLAELHAAGQYGSPLW